MRLLLLPLYRVHSIAPRNVSLFMPLSLWILCFMHNNDQICNGITYIYTIRSSVYYFYFIIPFHLCFIVCPFFPVSTVALRFSHHPLYLNWRNSAKTLPNSHTEWHLCKRNNDGTIMAKIQIVAFGTFSLDIMNYDELFCAFGSLFLLQIVLIITCHWEWRTLFVLSFWLHSSHSAISCVFSTWV